MNDDINKYTGIWPTLITPMHDDGTIDWPAYREFLEWQIAAGVGGLFANCLSSEMWDLTNEERLELAQVAVQVSAGRVPVAASGSFGEDISEHIAFSRQMADRGVDAVIMLLPGFCRTDDELEAYYLCMAEEVPCDLGLYECPVPEQRLLSTELVGRLAATGRYHPFKENSGDPDTTHAKLHATSGTALAVLPAAIPSLLESVAMGARGAMAIPPNVMPRLHVLMLARAEAGEDVTAAHRIACLLNAVINLAHPRSTKLMLSLQGLTMGEASRQLPDPLSAFHRKMITESFALLRDLAGEAVARLEERLAQ